MRTTVARSIPLRLLAVALLLAMALGVAACAQSKSGGSEGGAPQPAPAEKPAAQEQPKEPQYTSWTVHINDDDSYSQGGMTYKIALNFDAKHPGGDPSGKYAGNATASTSTEGNVGGAQLTAQAIAQSGNLSFALDDPSGGGALESLGTGQLPDMSGAGTITMKAAGTAHVGPAAGGFANTSSQKIEVTTSGSKATLKVTIQGHTYTFDGTISGNE